jgi:hypothetical protein
MRSLPTPHRPRLRIVQPARPTLEDPPRVLDALHGHPLPEVGRG